MDHKMYCTDHLSGGHLKKRRKKIDRKGKGGENNEYGTNEVHLFSCFCKSF